VANPDELLARIHDASMARIPVDIQRVLIDAWDHIHETNVALTRAVQVCAYVASRVPLTHESEDGGISPLQSHLIHRLARVQAHEAWLRNREVTVPTSWT